MTDDLNKTPKNTWTKVMFIALCFFGISAIVLGILQVSKTINLAGGNYAPSGDEIDYGDSLETDARSVEELQVADTDGDGLSDFEELYIYKTSMYLEDTDSDGYLDKDEVDDGYDPNCPKGVNCREQRVDDSGGYVEDYQYEDENTGEGAELTPELKDQLKDLTAEDVRQLLLESGGVTEEDLSQIDDETLMAFYLETLQSQ